MVGYWNQDWPIVCGPFIIVPDIHMLMPKKAELIICYFCRFYILSDFDNTDLINRLSADITPEDSGGDLLGHRGILLY